VEEEGGDGVNGGQCESALLLNPRQLDKYIGEGSTMMEEDRAIKPLSSLHYFLKKIVCPFFLWQSTYVDPRMTHLALKLSLGSDFLAP
jgi:hypothetical protein